jgi:hypothetical protein
LRNYFQGSFRNFFQPFGSRCIHERQKENRNGVVGFHDTVILNPHPRRLHTHEEVSFLQPMTWCLSQTNQLFPVARPGGGERQPLALPLIFHIPGRLSTSSVLILYLTLSLIDHNYRDSRSSVHAQILSCSPVAVKHLKFPVPV